MGEPKIYTKNYVNADDTFVVSSGAGSISNIYDRDIVSQWASSGANSDATDVTITITFYEGTVPTARTIDSFILMNHNMKACDLYYWNGSSYALWQSFTNLAASTLFQSLNPGLITSVQLVLHTTQTPNQEKMVGELVLCALQLDIGDDFATYNVQYRQKLKQLVMGDGSMQQALVFWSPNRCEKYEAACSFTNITQTQLNNLSAIKETGAPFLWYPESVQRPSEIFFVNWTNPLTWKYNAFLKSAGVTVSMQLKEV